MVNKVKIIGSFGTFNPAILESNINKFLITLPDDNDLKDIKCYYNPSVGHFALITYKDTTTSKKQIEKEQQEQEQLLVEQQQRDKELEDQTIKEFQEERLGKLKEQRKQGRPKKIQAF